jgi:hypothetical protein
LGIDFEGELTAPRENVALPKLTWEASESSVLLKAT